MPALEYLSLNVTIQIVVLSYVVLVVGMVGF